MPFVSSINYISFGMAIRWIENTTNSHNIVIVEPKITGKQVKREASELKRNGSSSTTNNKTVSIIRIIEKKSELIIANDIILLSFIYITSHPIGICLVSNCLAYLLDIHVGFSIIRSVFFSSRMAVGRTKHIWITIEWNKGSELTKQRQRCWEFCVLKIVCSFASHLNRIARSNGNKRRKKTNNHKRTTTTTTNEEKSTRRETERWAKIRSF